MIRLVIASMAGAFAIAGASIGIFAGGPLGSNQQSDTDVQIELILAGDLTAIVRAGRSGNKAYLPALKSVLADTQYEGYIDATPVEQARLALARLGEAEALLDYWCGAIAQDPVPRVSALGAIGGWFTFQAVEKIFDGVGDAAFERALRQAKATDITYRSPASLGLDVLGRIAKDPPIGRPDYPDDEPKYIKIWREWIRAHESELRTLAPTGEGVEFSEQECTGRRRRTSR